MKREGESIYLVKQRNCLGAGVFSWLSSAAHGGESFLRVVHLSQICKQRTTIIFGQHCVIPRMLT